MITIIIGLVIAVLVAEYRIQKMGNMIAEMNETIYILKKDVEDISNSCKYNENDILNIQNTLKWGD